MALVRYTHLLCSRYLNILEPPLILITIVEFFQHLTIYTVDDFIMHSFSRHFFFRQIYVSDTAFGTLLLAYTYLYDVPDFSQFEPSLNDTNMTSILMTSGHTVAETVLQ